MWKPVQLQSIYYYYYYYYFSKFLPFPCCLEKQRIPHLKFTFVIQSDAVYMVLG